MPNEIDQNLLKIRGQISSSCTKSGRPPSSVQILAATKSQPVEKIQQALSAGIALFGENYLQEGQRKINELGGEVQWHFIGHLQSNKAKKAIELFNCIQSVDSLKLAKKISALSPKPYPIFIEVNIAKEKTKFGVSPEKLPQFHTELKLLPNLQIRGLFCMPPPLPPEQARPFFQRMHKLAAQLSLRELSMGMSNDFPVAVEEGSTMVRLGTALFGPRK